MIRDNGLFQSVLFLIFLFSGVFYVVRGAQKKDKKRLIAGVLLLTFGWSKAVLLLERWSLDPLLKMAAFFQGYVDSELAEVYLIEGKVERAKEHANKAHETLSNIHWVAESEPERLLRLKKI